VGNSAYIQIEGEGKRIARLSSEQVAALVNAMPNESTRNIVLFALYTGRRKEEILSQRIENVVFHDLSEGTATYTARFSFSGGEESKYD